MISMQLLLDTVCSYPTLLDNRLLKIKNNVDTIKILCILSECLLDFGVLRLLSVLDVEMPDRHSPRSEFPQWQF